MNEHKSLLAKIISVIDEHRAERRAKKRPPPEQSPSRLPRFMRWLLPNGGTLLIVLFLIATQSVWSLPLRSPSATSTSTINYQGRLADTAGEPLTGMYNMVFRIYDVPTGGSPLWEENWVTGNSVEVSDGLFNVMLGSINNTLAGTIAGHDELYLGIAVGTDNEMSPRVQLGSVPFSLQALTVPDGSISSEKLALNHGTMCLSDHLALDLPGGGGWHTVDVPGLSLPFTLEKDSTVLTWIDGSIYCNLVPDTDECAINLLLDDVPITAEAEWSRDFWITNVYGQRITELSQGTHTLKVNVASGGVGQISVRGTGQYGTCINYLVLGQ